MKIEVERAGGWLSLRSRELWAATERQPRPRPRGAAAAVIVRARRSSSSTRPPLLTFLIRMASTFDLPGRPRPAVQEASMSTSRETQRSALVSSTMAL